ncbi:nuclear transport factor 2 family protein [Aestuariivirga sp.]|uniref:nuclear transport factor 2 family protein n=1 Tax=Aestuariivirga sp. TaxID=2650926 RepID=UPI003BAA9C7D
MAGSLDTVKKALQAFRDKDRDGIEAVIGDPYRFTSPRDNAIDRETFFARCWPNSESFTGMDVIHGAEDGEWAFVVYEASAGGKRFRNAEVHRVQNGRIIETEVYFGWNLPHEAERGGFI